jgi:glycosyltransferase involved in cell wall biosynthesis
VIGGKRAAAAIGLAKLAANAHRSPQVPSPAPLVSVVIATYNWSSVLRHAIRSALWQTYPMVEVIVVGDGCTDDSEEVVRSIGDDRVRWDNLPANSGSQSAPNNRGLELARGKYVAYLGHDDLWLPTHLAYLVAAVERSGCGIGVSGSLRLGPPGSNVRKLRAARRIGRRGVKPPSSILHLRELVDQVGGWRDYRELEIPPDTEFTLRLGETGAAVGTGALTVFKFNSAWRPQSYRLKLDDEQREYARRMVEERFFVERELAAWLWLRFRGLEPKLPHFNEPPTPSTLGWQVREYRRVRGLPPDP